jgi:hypothetical protein
MKMNKVNWFAVVDLLQTICLSLLYFYFSNKNEQFIASIIGLILAISLLLVTVPELVIRMTKK